MADNSSLSSDLLTETKPGQHPSAQRHRRAARAIAGAAGACVGGPRSPRHVRPHRRLVGAGSSSRTSPPSSIRASPTTNSRPSTLRGRGRHRPVARPGDELTHGRQTAPCWADHYVTLAIVIIVVVALLSAPCRLRRLAQQAPRRRSRRDVSRRPPVRGRQAMTNLLMRATGLVGLPVVTTTTGEDIAETRDVIYVPDQGRVVGFTLNKRGRFAGRLKNVLAMEQIARCRTRCRHGRRRLGARHARQAPTRPRMPRAATSSAIAVLTDAGKQLGIVRDLIVEMSQRRGHRLRTRRRPRTPAGRRRPAAASPAVDPRRLQRRAHGPGDVEEFIRDDLAGFGSAVNDFRARLREA